MKYLQHIWMPNNDFLAEDILIRHNFLGAYGNAPFWKLFFNYLIDWAEIYNVYAFLKLIKNRFLTFFWVSNGLLAIVVQNSKRD